MNVASLLTLLRGPGALGWAWMSLLIMALDQLTKSAVMARFELFQRTEILPFFDLVRLHNTGAAFSFLASAGGWQRAFFITISVLVSGGLLIWLRRLPPRGQTPLAVGLACIIGGALGNLWDRVQLGHVVDFIHLHVADWYYPAFNVADIAITTGAALVILDAFLEWRRERKG